jgi:putative endonuclease
MASRSYGTLYIGVTTDLAKRVYQHKEELSGGFTRQYGVHRLVYYEVHEDILGAIEREKQLKKWKRAWKLELIISKNPDWLDLSDELV